MPAEPEKPIEQIKKLEQFIPEKSKEEMAQILAYGERIKARGERKKKEFRAGHIRYTTMGDFKKLLYYMREHKKEVQGKYKYLDKMNEMEREKFIAEYLHDDMLYSGEPEPYKFKKLNVYEYYDRKTSDIIVQEGDYFSFSNKYIGNNEAKEIANRIKLKKGVRLLLVSNKLGDEGAKAIANMELNNGVELNLTDNEIGDEGAEAIANMELKNKVNLGLSNNNIGPKGAIAMAQNMHFKDGVKFGLRSNKIGDEGAKAISRMELKNGVELDLYNNQILAEGAKAIAKNMKLREGVTLDLGGNKFGDEGVQAIAENMKFKCGVELDLQSCGIGEEGVKALSKMKFKDGVYLDISWNHIGDEGVQAIIDNMELVEGMKLDLKSNNISKEMKQKLKAWIKYYRNKGIHCTVDF